MEGQQLSDLINQNDILGFQNGEHTRIYNFLGAHKVEINGNNGYKFAVWAPNAKYVSVIGSFNGWDKNKTPLNNVGYKGIWSGFVPELGNGELYKYYIESKVDNYCVSKADPIGFLHQAPPETASITCDLNYNWNDNKWMSQRHRLNSINNPISVYEVHLGSWKRPGNGKENDYLSYRDIAPLLTDYVLDMGFSHVEFLPIMEHPFYGSWGYQVTGYFAPTHRYGTPEDFMYLIDTLHQAGIGVILDWVPSHFPTDEHGIGFFDGTHLYEHEDPRKGFHPDWSSFIFNYGRYEVLSFLLSSAVFWLEKYHADGLRVDGVASILYLDYSRNEGEWVPNKYGGRENLEAVEFLKKLNQTAFGEFKDIQMIAEESTAWPMVSKPVYLGGLGFNMKWDMGWMHDSLKYFSTDPLYRCYHHNLLTFRMIYAYSENFTLSLSHDEVVHLKGSLIEKMPGDKWQKFANLKILYAYMFAQPGKKLLFMGDEFGQYAEWNHDKSLDWHLLDNLENNAVKSFVKDMNRLYKNEKSLYELDFDEKGFKWIDCDDSKNSIISFIRYGCDKQNPLFFIFNFTPNVHYGYQIGVPIKGAWQEILNSDAKEYAGSGIGNNGRVESVDQPSHDYPASLVLTLPPLACLCFKPDFS